MRSDTLSGDARRTGGRNENIDLNRFRVLVAVERKFQPQRGAQQIVSGASLDGQIADVNRAALSSVSVAATNLETDQTRTVVGDAAGRFRFAFLPIGNYRIEAARSGFDPTIQNLTLTVGQKAEIRLQFTTASHYSYVVTPLYVEAHTGIIAKQIRRVPPAYLRDVTLSQSFWQKLVGTATVKMTATAAGDDKLEFADVINGEKIRTLIWNLIRAQLPTSPIFGNDKQRFRLQFRGGVSNRTLPANRQKHAHSGVDARVGQRLYNRQKPF